jgi:site-specific DNA-methyltransferase (cytosine-N4-specific)
MQNFKNEVFFKNSTEMKEIPDNSINLIITSPPYFNVKDYSKDGKQQKSHSVSNKNDLGSIDLFSEYINRLLLVWKECERILKPNGKLCINAPLMPIPKKIFSNHYNRNIYDIQSEIQNSILSKSQLFLIDLYIWNRTNSSKKLMFGSYPYPGNFYAQNSIEFITIYVKDGKPEKTHSERDKLTSKLTQKEWVEYTKQIWDIPIPNKSDKAFGIHSAIMPEESVRRCIKLFSFKGDIVLDPFAGSGTTLKVAHELDRNFVGYELYESYKDIIWSKINAKK